MSEPQRANDVSCVFCQVIAGELEAEVVLSDDDFVAFLDHRPVQKGHILMVPRQHLETLLDLPPELHERFVANSQRLAAAVVDGLDAQGSFVAINNVVSQSVPHLHLHVVPRRRGDGLKGFFWPRHKYSVGEQQEYADRLRAVLG
ncbi:histidine triad (HIT) family protein [Nocardioides albertanoniae]|uniref:Histidine triad (HIT) family protein n=1 Tax=Nocardioides albertanoniae TaxID=1175486 RepID=A0A543AAN4_9ACTN|nr:HIT family protein [Nocardioides albertanoniae]TQL69657.1 histidine triad (HIT) family protein [Nocardioides albertanoniae]